MLLSCLPPKFLLIYRRWALSIVTRDASASLTCDQVLVLVDVELHAAQTLRGVRVDVLHMLNFLESFVHLQDTRSKSELKQLEREKKRKRQLSDPPRSIKTARWLYQKSFYFRQEFLWREGVQSSAPH